MTLTDTLAEYDFYEIASVDDLPNGERIFLEIGDQPVVVFNIAGIPDRDACGRREYRFKCTAGTNDGQ